MTPLLSLNEAQVYVGIRERYARSLMAAGPPDQIITRGGANEAAYMQRWWLRRAAKVHDGTEHGNVYLHRFDRPDADEAPHDHPWRSASIVLAGRYLEVTPDGSFWRETGWRGERHADAIHAIKEVEPGTITIFLTGKKEREWGFMTRHGKVPWSLHDAYLALPQEHREAYYRDQVAWRV